MNSISKRMVRTLNISDIHLGHDKNPTAAIAANLDRYFDDYSEKSIFAKVDIINIVGDLTDQLLDVESPSLYEIMGFLYRLIMFCARFKIKLRILEGTPSHDRKQARIAETLAELLKTTADVKWIKTLHVEYMEDLDLSVLYIPDEYTANTETTLGLVRELFKEKNIEKVDVAMMHGMFHYQMCNIPGKHDVHDEQAYLGLVRHFICIGHIHTHSSYERIIAQGSFDRLAQGEEEPKGGVLMTIRDNGVDYFEFIANKHAKIFKTINIESPDLVKSLTQVDKELKRIPDHSYIRIRAPKHHGIFPAIPELRAKYPFIHFAKLSIEEEESISLELPVQNDYKVVQIRPENVVSLIMGEISGLSLQDTLKLEHELETLQEAM